MKIRMIICVLFACLAVVPCHAAPCVVTGAVYHPDTPYPEFMRLWQEGWSLKDANGEKVIYARPDMPLGGYVFIYFRNTGADAITVTDLTLEGIKLSEGIGVTDKPKSPEDKFGASVLLSKLPKEQIDRLKAAGQPVWWKQEPRVVPAGGMGEIVIRMKRNPVPERISVGLVTGKGTVETQVSTRTIQPRFATIAFSPDLQTAYLYARHPKPGTRPSKVFIDGIDATSSAVIASDKTLDVSPIVVKLSKPLIQLWRRDLAARIPLRVLAVEQVVPERPDGIELPGDRGRLPALHPKSSDEAADVGGLDVLDLGDDALSVEMCDEEIEVRSVASDCVRAVAFLYVQVDQILGNKAF